MKKISIAIDGPAGAGKSTVAKKVAKELGFLYIDTGSMYRALTFIALELCIDPNNDFLLNQYLMEKNIHLVSEGENQKVIIDGINVTDKIRSPEVNKSVSLVASHKNIRETMVKKQRALAKNGNVVMDGRDIGTNVLPNADVKIFLNATIEERANRRYKELTEKGYKVDLMNLIEDISSRDKMDQERAVAPLKMAEDAILIDSSNLSINDVVQKIINIIKIERGD
ncbi:MAG: (d)CMP kinase [Vulcanibacillus sp.]